MSKGVPNQTVFFTEKDVEFSDEEDSTAASATSSVASKSRSCLPVWFDDSDDDDDEALWKSHLRLCERGELVTKEEFGWFVLCQPEFFEFARGARTFDCFPWWPRSTLKPLQSSTEQVEKALRDEAMLIFEFVRSVRAAEGSGQSLGVRSAGSLESVRMETFVYKLSRLKQRHIDGVMRLRSLRIKHGAPVLEGAPIADRLPRVEAPTELLKIKARDTARQPVMLNDVVAIVVRLLDASGTALLSATCTTLYTLCCTDKIWREFFGARFGRDLQRADGVSYRRLHAAFANAERRRQRRAAISDATLKLRIGSAETCVRVPLCGLKRSQKQRVLRLMSQQLASCSALNDATVQWVPVRAASSAVEVYDIGGELFSARAKAICADDSLMVYVVDNNSRDFFGCRAPAHLYYTLARTRACRAVLVVVLMWRSNLPPASSAASAARTPPSAFEVERVARDLYSSALVRMRVCARVQAVCPHTGAGLADGMKWLYSLR